MSEPSGGAAKTASARRSPQAAPQDGDRSEPDRSVRYGEHMSDRLNPIRLDSFSSDPPFGSAPCRDPPEIPGRGPSMSETTLRETSGSTTASTSRRHHPPPQTVHYGPEGGQPEPRPVGGVIHLRRRFTLRWPKSRAPRPRVVGGVIHLRRRFTALLAVRSVALRWSEASSTSADGSPGYHPAEPRPLVCRRRHPPPQTVHPR